MADRADTARAGWIGRNWKALTAAGVAVVGFLTWYDSVRNQGRLFVCDMAALVGQSETIAICRDGPPPVDDRRAMLDWLKEREDRLTADRRALMERLEAALIDETLAELAEAAGIEGSALDARAEADTREAVRETVEEGDAEERRALERIADGEVDGGLALLTELAAEPTADTAARWRRIGRIAYPVDTRRALDAYEKIVALDPSDPWDAIYLGRLHARAGDLEAARRIFEEALGRLPEAAERDRGALDVEIGNVRLAEGDLAGALESYRAAMAIDERLAEADPSNAGWQHDLSVSHNKIGDALRDLGDLDGALESYRAAMAIRERLAKVDPSNAGWQRDLSVAHNKIGDALHDQGDLDRALESYRAAMAIRERLAEADPSNAGWQRDLSVAHNKIGDALRDRGDLDGALKGYRAAMAIAGRLAEADPNNAGWQRDLSVSHEKIGDVRRDRGDIAGALESYRRSMAIISRLVEVDPKNAGWQRHRAVSLWKLAGVPESGVTWADVAAAWEGMESSGVLRPVDRRHLEEAQRRAAGEGR